MFLSRVGERINLAWSDAAREAALAARRAGGEASNASALHTNAGHLSPSLSPVKEGIGSRAGGAIAKGIGKALDAAGAVQRGLGHILRQR